ncbi:MAG: hypothetical protein MUF06_13330 [Pirellulaceae bacterium]|jgi:hypothetical protein|nr:hypothetical protein [Pirellulaceae bacterium]
MFGKMLQQMGFWTTILSWREPVSFRSRLKGDLFARLAIALGVGLVATAILLVLFAVNRNPPHPVFSLVGLLLFGTMTGLILLKGEATASGNVRVCEEGITRQRQLVPKIPVYQQFEEANWPFGSFSRAIFVPAQAIGQSFSVLVLTDERNYDLIGLPAKIDPAQLAQLLASRGVVVQQAHFVPQEYTRGINLPLAGAVGAMGLFASLGGLLFYAVSNAGPAPAVAERANIPQIAALDFGPPPPAPVIAAAPPPPPAVQPAAAPEAVEPENVPAASPPDDLPDGLPGFPRLRRPNPFEQPRPPINPFEAANTPPTTPPAAATADGLVGGAGGVRFESKSPTGEPVVGLRYRVGSWAGKSALGSVDPIFDRSDFAAGQEFEMAREGYALAGLEVNSAEFVHAVKGVFARQKPDGSLDLADTYTSDWLGTPAGDVVQKVEPENQPATGIVGRRGAVIDAIGLVRGN